MFPQFAAELGGGQNIYNFAYYGLFNPLYLLSYMLPFIKMTTYIQALALLEHIADGILCYCWLGRGHFRRRESFYASVMLALAASVTYHSSMQLMFVNYMPFLLLALIGYDRYCENGKYGLLTVSVLCMILTSFYFAVGGLAALFIYGACGYRHEKGASVWGMIKWFWYRYYPALLGCLLSLFYLVPVYFAMSAGRTGHAAQSLKELLVPDIRLHKLLYSGYGMGLSVAALILLCASIFYRRCREKYMAATLFLLLLFPVFDWLLNGTLYLRDKAFIPFLPLMCWLAASFFYRIGSRLLRAREAVGGCVLAGVLLTVSLLTNTYVRQEQYFIYIDFAVCAAAIAISMYCWKKAVSTVMLAVMALLCVGQVTLLKEELVTKAEMERIESPAIGKAVESVQGGGSYRTETRDGYSANKANQNKVWVCGQNLTTVYSSISNPYYSSFRSKVLHLSKPSRNSLMADTVDSPVFLKIMGVRYIVGSRAPDGYKKINRYGDVNIYENNEVAPSVYVTDQIMTEEDFLTLSWPERQLAMLRTAVADTKEAAVESKERAAEVDVHMSASRIKGSASSGILTVDNDREEDAYLFLEFDVKNNKAARDVTVTVNGEQNKLSADNAAYYNANTTFHYTSLLSAGENEVPVEYGEGDYEISNVHAWIGRADEKETRNLYSSPVSLNVTGAGNVLEGTARSGNGGWLVTSIPYDENFKLYVDGRQEKIHKINTAFIGAPLKEGVHQVRLVYEAKGRTAGIAATLAALGILGADLIRRKRRLHGKI